MRAEAKRSSAANYDGSATRGPVSGRSDDATRASSLSADGSGAPSRGRVFALALTASALLTAIVVAIALAAPKEVVTYFGNASGSGTIGGQFNNPRDVAVNRTGTGAPTGTTYVADDANNRIQRFDASGNFVSAWGMDVTAASANEQQKITVAASSGTYKLTFNGQTSAPIAYNASAATVQSALTALSSIGSGNATVSGSDGGPYTVTFQGILAGANQPQITSDTAFLVGSVAVSTLVDGTNSTGGSGTGFEICTTAAYCKAGTATGGNGSVGGDGALNHPQSVAVDSDTGNVYVSDRDNKRVNEYSATGSFIRSFGFDVLATASEIQAATITAASGSFTLSYGAGGVGVGTTADIPVGSNAATVQGALNAITNISTGGGSVTATGPSSGVYTITFAGSLANTDVSDQIVGASSSGDPLVGGTITTALVQDGSAAGTGYEVCKSTQICQVGQGGNGAGQIGATSTGGTLGIAVSPTDGNAVTGTVFLADSQNQRVDTYALDGTSPASFGSSAQFGVGQPTKVAVDSRGIVYASNSNAGNEVERYDSLNANGGGVGFLAPLLAPSNETQKVTFTGFATNDTFTLTCPNGQTTGNIPYDTTALGLNVIQVALDANCGAGNTNTNASSNPPNVTISFMGANVGVNVPTTVCTKVTGSGSCSVSLETNGHGGPLLGSNGSSTTATAGLAVDPDSDGAGSDTNVLYVLRTPLSGQSVVQQFGPTNSPGNATAPSADDAEHGSGAGFFSVQGLGINDISGQLFVSSTDIASGLDAGHRVYVLKDPTSLSAPVLTIDNVTTSADTTATLSGTVNPMGALVSCKFQYSTDQTSWTDFAAPGCASLSSGGGAQAISQAVTGLVPNTHYYVRLSVSRPFVSNSATLSAVKAFDTTAVAPAVSNVGSIDVQDTSARLVGTIDPRHSATGYVFQYGPTPALGSATNAVNIGSGATPLIVSQVISDLNPNTTYYFRLAATNAVATTTGTSSTLTTRATPLPLPDDRRYERVTPDAVGKGLIGADAAIIGQSKFTVAENGNALSYCNAGAGGAQTTLRCGDYISRRDPNVGWGTKVLAPPACGNDLSQHAFTVGGQVIVAVSKNLDYAAIAQPEAADCGVAPLDPAAPLPGLNLYRESLATPFPTFDLLTPRLGNPINPLSRSFNTINGNLQGGSDDYGHILFQSTGDQCLPVACGITVSTAKNLFEWDHGVVRLVARATNDSPLSGTSALGGNPLLAGPSSKGVGGVSASGTRIFFQNPTPTNGNCAAANTTCELYLRKDGASTTLVSQQECSPSCSDSGGADIFLWANPAGDKALFATGAKLVNADTSPIGSSCPNGGTVLSDLGGIRAFGCDLYEYRDSANPGTDPNNLVDLSQDNEPADGNSGSVVGPLGMSDDGNTVYFAATGQLVANGPTAAGPKVYRWQWNNGTPTLRYLTTLNSVGDGENWNTAGGDPRPWVKHVDPAGQYLLLGTKAPLDPVADLDTDRDIYRWSEAGGWTCLSCQLPDAPSAGDAAIQKSKTGAGSLTQNADLLRSASDDFQRVFFTTPDALVPEDVNGQSSCPQMISGQGFFSAYRCQDLYEWHDGRVSLVSTGTGASPAILLGTTPSGNDVFFLSADQLTGWDTDNLNDAYDARVGGGFPEPEPTGSCDLNAGACEGAGSSAPQTTGAGTAVFQGQGNRRSDSSSRRPSRCPRGKRKVTRNGRTRCVKRNRKANANRRAGR